MKKIKRRGRSQLKMKIRRRKKVRVEFIGTGCTTLNLALSGFGKIGGWARGRIVRIVGDGSSGKTLLALEACFWVFNNILKTKSVLFPDTKKFKIIFYNTEGVMDFPLEEMYGGEFVKVIDWKQMKTVEKITRHMERSLDKYGENTFILFIIDSWDATKSTASKKRIEESVKSNKDVKMGYGLEKQKYASDFFGNYCHKLDNNKYNSTLMIISQTRANIGVQFGRKTKAGGGAWLNFFTHQSVWVREVKKLSKKKKGEERVYGIRGHAKVERSKVAKPFRESHFTFLYDYGLDDLGSMVHYVFGDGPYKINNKSFKKHQAFIKHIEKENLQEKLIAMTEEKWNDVESAFKKEIAERKTRF